MYLLGIDLGTTNTKAALFDRTGRLVRHAKRATLDRQDDKGVFYYDPEEMWQTVVSVVREVLHKISPDAVHVLAVAGMAETGLLLDRSSLEPRTPLIPWFDDACIAHVDQVRNGVDPLDRFQHTGLYPSFKHGLVKILWLKETTPEILDSALWLSAPGYVTLRLTGRPVFDPTLAVRTYAWSLQERAWHSEWLERFQLRSNLFPDVIPSGSPAGHLTAGAAGELGLSSATTVALSGHDHVCASLAAGAIAPGVVMDSMGTAETLMGVEPDAPLTEEAFRSGLSYGPHVTEGRRFWSGGCPSSGGAVEWLRSAFGDPPVPYDDLMRALESVPVPCGLLYFPYLSGSGAPQPNPDTQGAFIGLEEDYGRGHLFRAVLEGTAYELETIRRAAQSASGNPIERAVVVGGGTRNPVWMQIKADVYGMRLDVPDMPEAAALGAVMAAGIGCGVYRNPEDAVASVHAGREVRAVTPDPERHALYTRWLEEGYLPLQEPLRQHYARVAGWQKSRLHMRPA